MNFENQKLELLKQKHYSNNIFENKKKKIEDINNTLVPISKKENFIKKLMKICIFILFHFLSN